VAVVYLYRRTVSGFVFWSNRRAGSVGGGGPRAGTAGINMFERKGPGIKRFRKYE
jgi:hypothetical protein